MHVFDARGSRDGCVRQLLHVRQGSDVLEEHFDGFVIDFPLDLAAGESKIGKHIDVETLAVMAKGMFIDRELHLSG
jgi:hypothetical protein